MRKSLISRRPGRPKAEGIPHPIKPYLTIEQVNWLNRQPNKSQSIANLIQEKINQEEIKMENTTAYYVTNNAYDSIVIPARNVCIIHPDALAIEFHSGDANFADWDGASIKDQVAPINIEDLSEHQIAELFGEIVESKHSS